SALLTIRALYASAARLAMGSEQARQTANSATQFANRWPISTNSLIVRKSAPEASVAAIHDLRRWIATENAAALRRCCLQKSICLIVSQGPDQTGKLSGERASCKPQ